MSGGGGGGDDGLSKLLELFPITCLLGGLNEFNQKGRKKRGYALFS